MIYVILGTTASGKTDLALSLARKFSMPLISADAYQVYREFAIGTAAPTLEECVGVEHYFIHDRSIKNPIDVKEYQTEARALLDRFVKAGQDVILSGGTFLYIRAALFAYEFPVESEKSFTYEGRSDEELYAILCEQNPNAASSIHPHNVRRVMRALLNGANRKAQSEEIPQLLYPATFLAIDRPAEEVKAAIEERTTRMFEAGLIREVSDLMKDPGNLTTAFMAIGYKEVRCGLKAGKKEEEIKEDVIVHTRQYAKRQRTFLRHQFPGMLLLKPAQIADLVIYDQEKKQRTIAALGTELYGKIERQRVLVCGLGGVGAIAAETLARIGVKQLAIVDQDRVEISNINRQALFNRTDVGRWKVDVAKEKLLEIDPLLTVNAHCKTIDGEFVTRLAKYDWVFDCIDDVEAKVRLAIYAQLNGAELIMCTGTARKRDSTRLRMGFLSETGEPLAKATKRRLQKQGFDVARIRCIYSAEAVLPGSKAILPSLPTVPNAAGLAMVTYFIDLLN